MAYKPGDPLINTSFFFRASSQITFYFVWTVAQIVSLILFSTRYSHRKKLAKVSRAVLVSNHTTFLDPVMVSGAMMPRRTWHTLLEPTVKTPFLGTFTRLLGGIPIPRGKNGLRRLTEACETAFRYRRFVHFYPEGECYLYNQEVREFKTGAFVIAAELDVPVIPLATVFSRGRREPGTFLARKYPKQRLVVLDPIHPSAYVRRTEDGQLDMGSVAEFAEAARQKIQGEIAARNGCGDYYKGKLERIRGINDQT